MDGLDLPTNDEKAPLAKPRAPGEEIDLASLGDLALAGLQAMEDPPRAEAVAACRRSGVAGKMITGDHAATAAAIAHRVGLSHDARPAVVTGADLAVCPDADLPGARRGDRRLRPRLR